MSKKKFILILPNLPHINEYTIRRALEKMVVGQTASPEEIEVYEQNKTSLCDCCGKERRDVKACGQDADGCPDAPDACFLCRKEGSRGRAWSFKLEKYVPYGHQFAGSCRTIPGGITFDDQ